jgi:hypothetical protein
LLKSGGGGGTGGASCLLEELHARVSVELEEAPAHAREHLAHPPAGGALGAAQPLLRGLGIDHLPP